MAPQMVYYNGITFKFRSSSTDPQQNSSNGHYHVPQDLYRSISSGDIQNAVDYVLRRRGAYKNHPEAGANQCLAVTVAIYDRLGAENAFRFYKGMHGKYLCCANILDVVTDVVIDLWPDISQDTSVELLTVLLKDISIKSWSLPDDSRIDTGYKLVDRPPATQIALTYHPVEMLIVHDMVEKLRSMTELAHYQHELGSLESTPEWAEDFAAIELETLPGVLRSVLRRDPQYRKYADWRRGTGYKWRVYTKPKDDFTNWDVLKELEHKFDFTKDVVTRDFDRDEEKIKADNVTMNHFRYMAMQNKISIHQLDRKYVFCSINMAQRNELFDIMTGVKDESDYDMEPLQSDYDQLQSLQKITDVSKGILGIVRLIAK